MNDATTSQQSIRGSEYRYLCEDVTAFITVTLTVRINQVKIDNDERKS